MNTTARTIKVTNPNSKIFVLLDKLRQHKEEQRRMLRENDQCVFKFEA